MNGDERSPTNGERMAWAGRRLIAARQPAAGWRTALAPVLRRLHALPVPSQDRYRRIDAVDVTPVQATATGWAGDTLPSPVRDWLRPLVGGSVDLIRAHTGAAGATVTEAHAADAVTFGRDVYFDAGRMPPADCTGYALIAHEAVHVAAAAQASAGWSRATAAGRADEEALALDIEARIRAGVALDDQAPRPTGAPAGPIWGPTAHERAGDLVAADPGWSPIRRSATRQPAVPAVSAGAAPTPAAAQPMAARIDRDLSPPLAPAAGPAALPRDVYHELLAQLRTDFERGA